MLVYSIIGALFGVVATLVIIHYKKAGLPTGKLIGVYALWIVGLVALCFGIDWAYASLTETEPQSAAMGLLMFGGIGIILGVIGFRLGLPKKEGGKPASQAVEEA